MRIIITMMTMLFLFDAVALTSELAVKNGDVKFTAIGKPGFLKIRGESKGTSPKGTIHIEDQTASGEFSFDLKNLDTGLELRNEHMKDKYLEIAKYPVAKLSLKPIPLKPSDLESDIKKPFKGSLLLHGVTQDIDGEFMYNAKKKNVTVHFAIKVSDFKIDIPKYLGVTVSESVEIEVMLDLK